MANISTKKNAEFSTGENFADLLQESIKTEKNEGDLIKGRVVGIENDIVIVDIGLKTEGRVSIREFIGPDNNLKVNTGDEIEVYLERIENLRGEAVISYERAQRQKSWSKFEEDHKEGDNVEGTIFGRVKGGFTVDIGGVVAFLPGSQVDVRPVKDIGPLMGVKQPFQILKIDHEQGNIVVSRRAILEESREEARNEMLSKVREGVVMEGVVKNITDYGAFVDLGSIDGLLHVTDISWSRINHPSEVLSVGQTIKVQVIKYNDDTKRISLGMKQLEENPWKGIEQRFPVNSKCKGTVTNITDYGAFVEIEQGIEGLVHVSEVNWAKNNVHPSKLLSVGQEVEIMVLDVDASKHRISLGMKQCEANPWEAFAAENPIGSVLEGEVKNVVEFGLFVGFGNKGVDGLVHLSDLSWDDETEAQLKKFKSGDKITVKVLDVSSVKERISLGVKQLMDDPKQAALGGIKKGGVVTCVVSEVKPDGIEVEVNESVKSFIKKGDLARDRIEQRPERFAVGDKVDAKVTFVDKLSAKITLSIRALEVEEQKRAIEEYGSADSGASLGDILGAALNSSKAAANKKAEAEAEAEAEKKPAKKTKAKASKEDKSESNE